MFVVEDPIMETLAEISSKSHAFEDPDHFLIATAFSRNSRSTVYLWNTIGQGDCHSFDSHDLCSWILFRSVGTVKAQEYCPVGRDNGFTGGMCGCSELVVSVGV